MGAAFRTPYCSVDIAEARKTVWKKLLLEFADTSTISKLKGGWFQNAVYSFVMKERIEKTKADSKMIISEVQSNHNFYQQFLG